MLGQDAIGDLALGQPFGLATAAPVGTGTFTIAGQGATLSYRKQLVAAAGAYTLGAQSVTFTYIRSLHLLAGTGAYTLSPKTITGGVHHLLNAGVGAYTLSGRPGSLTQILGAAQTSFAWTGVNINFGRNYLLSPAAGALTLGSRPATLLWLHQLTPVVGAFAVAGSATLTFTRQLAGGVGSFAIAGVGASLLEFHKLFAPTARDVPIYRIADTGATGIYPIRVPLRTFGLGTGAFQLFPKTAALTQSKRTLSAGTGAFVLAGNSSTATKATGKAIFANFGTYIVAPKTTTMLRKYVLSPAAGAFALAGSNVGSVYNHVLNGQFGHYDIGLNTAPLTRVRKILAAPGAFALTSTSTLLADDRTLFTGTGAFSIAGSTVPGTPRFLHPAVGIYLFGPKTAQGIRSLVLSAAAGAYRMQSPNDLFTAKGSFVLAAQPATISHTRPFNAAAGAFAIAGVGSTLTYLNALRPAMAAFTISAAPATITFTRRASAAPGTIVLVGPNQTLLRKQVLTALPGSFALAPKTTDGKRGSRKLIVPAGVFRIEGKPIGFIEAAGDAFGEWTLAGDAELEWTTHSNVVVDVIGGTDVQIL